jgi:hypothetical protein
MAMKNQAHGLLPGENVNAKADENMRRDGLEEGGGGGAMPRFFATMHTATALTMYATMNSRGMIAIQLLR